MARQWYVAARRDGGEIREGRGGERDEDGRGGVVMRVGGKDPGLRTGGKYTETRMVESADDGERGGRH